MLCQLKTKTGKALFYSLLIIPVLSGAQSLLPDSALGFKRTSWLSNNKHITQLDSYVDSVLKSYMQSPENCGISIGITENGNEYFYNYGEIQRASKILPDQNTIYEIGSLTSVFCGHLLAQAVVDGKLRMEDDIRNYLPGTYPELQYKGEPILVQQLVNHTAGLASVPGDIQSGEGYDPLDPYASYTKEKLLAYLKTVKLVVLPGSTCDYSNMGIAILGIVLEGVYQKPFEDLVKDVICAPLTLTNTTVGLTEFQKSKQAKGYNERGRLTPFWHLAAFESTGGLHSTTGDLLRFIQYNLEEKDAATKLSHQATFEARQKVGFAWFIKKTRQNNVLYWHTGATYGFSAFTGFIKDKKCGVVILANSGRNMDYIGIALLNYLQR